MKTQTWRVVTLLSGVMMMLGGPRHPSPRLDLAFGESTAHMLADPNWVSSHALLLASDLLLLVGLALWRAQVDLPEAVSRWGAFAVAAVALVSVEMGFHLAAVVDLEPLRAGRATPVLSTHLLLTTVAYPLQGIALSGLAIRGAAVRRLGSHWVSWLAVAGGLGFGAAALYVVLTRDQRVSPLFAISSVLLAAWFLAIALWPARTSAGPSRTP